MLMHSFLFAMVRLQPHSYRMYAGTFAPSLQSVCMRAQGMAPFTGSNGASVVPFTGPNGHQTMLTMYPPALMPPWGHQAPGPWDVPPPKAPASAGSKKLDRLRDRSALPDAPPAEQLPLQTSPSPRKRPPPLALQDSPPATPRPRAGLSAGLATPQAIMDAPTPPSAAATSTAIVKAEPPKAAAAPPKQILNAKALAEKVRVARVAVVVSRASQAGVTFSLDAVTTASNRTCMRLSVVMICSP